MPRCPVQHSGLAPGTLRYISHCESYHLIRGNCRAVGRDLHTECNMFILSTFQSRATDYKVTARSRLSRYRSKLSQRVNYFTADLCPCIAPINPAAADSTQQTRTRGFASNSSALELETNAIRRFAKVSIVSYSRPSLMITASASQFHFYLPWGQRPFSIVS